MVDVHSRIDPNADLDQRLGRGRKVNEKNSLVPRRILRLWGWAISKECSVLVGGEDAQGAIPQTMQLCRWREHLPEAIDFVIEHHLEVFLDDRNERAVRCCIRHIAVLLCSAWRTNHGIERRGMSLRTVLFGVPQTQFY